LIFNILLYNINFMNGLIIGSAFAVSAGLIVYAIERDFIARSDALHYLIPWAVAGLILALVAAARGEDS
jgi:hypothetical protein